MTYTESNVIQNQQAIAYDRNKNGKKACADTKYT